MLNVNAVQLCNCDVGSCRVAACRLLQCCSNVYKEVVVPATSSTPSVDREAEMKCEYCWKVGNSRGFKPGLAKMTMVFIGQHKKWPPLSAAA